MTVYMLAIHGFVSTFVGLHHGAVQAHPSENACWRANKIESLPSV